MQLLVKGRNTDVTEKIKDYAQKRLSKFEAQLHDDVTRLELELIEERNPKIANCHVAEATIWTKGPTLRAKEASPDVFTSIDLVADKLSRQVAKWHDKKVAYKTGRLHHGNGNGKFKSAPHADPEDTTLLPAGAGAKITTEELLMASPQTLNIVKTKQFRLGPISPEQAALQMELVGHDFFVFVNSENNQTCVLYRRADGDLGLIEPTLTEGE
jgi:putative sigma-54 modulation protein